MSCKDRQLISEINTKTEISWWTHNIYQNVFDGLESKGIQETLRNEMEEEALDYINKQKEYGMVFNDPYWETYIYRKPLSNQIR